MELSLLQLSLLQVVVLCALAAVAVAIPLVPAEPPIPILRQSADGPNPDGSYNYNYETANGIQAQELGYLRYAGTTGEAREAQGSYSYTAPNGEVVQVSYVANENGFQPQGSHIPPIPPQILRALEYIAAHPEENNGDLQ
ncbi:PREDICTED: endocuticle structural glycoprotein ABD-4-like [Dufourea novaeangliae]|uniref:endocuticle structural glycoprotein ABD-4-like n=1 Tax=Dufourea novaeangliae TaxID=178035 RepID=UPI0007678651|nr:PREDICTED: endocuticle structural glycoprotein ABD-4-like [Dufourea novaeangliae]